MNDEPDFDDPEVWLAAASEGAPSTVYPPHKDPPGMSLRVREHELLVALGPTLLAHILNRIEGHVDRSVADFKRRVRVTYRVLQLVQPAVMATSTASGSSVEDAVRSWFLEPHEFLSESPADALRFGRFSDVLAAAALSAASGNV